MNNIIKCCKNCNRYNPAKVCKHDNIERILRLDKHEDCPFWIPIKNKQLSLSKEDIEFLKEL